MKTLLLTIAALALVAGLGIALRLDTPQEAGVPPPDHASLGGTAAMPVPSRSDANRVPGRLPATADDPPSAVAGAAEPMTAGVRHAVRAPAFDQLLDAYDPLAAGILADFDSRYRGALRFDAEAEFRWLEENGFPLPEEVLAASDLTTAQLKRRASGGEETAEFLYFDRLLEEIETVDRNYREAGLAEATVTGDPAFVAAFVEADRLRARIAGSESPFAGYLLARFAAVAVDDPYAELAGLYHAYSLGDPRALQPTQEVLRRNGIAEDANRALGAYALILRRRVESGDQ